MEINFNILIDASGSMGAMKDTADNGKYLLPDGSTRMDLVKKILKFNILPCLKFSTNINISSFRGEIQYDYKKNKIIYNNKLKILPKLDLIYNGKLNFDTISESLEFLKDPIEASTPLYFSLAQKIIKSKENKNNIIVFSDGGASDRENFDSEILNLIKTNKKDCCIHFIGINQKKNERLKSENLAKKTGGIYVNLKAMDYDESELNLLLSKLNSNIVTKAIQTNINDNNFIVEKSKSTPNAIEDNNLDSDIEKQVQKNTQSLEFISSQLTNIINLIQPKQNLIEEVDISENTIYNNKIGRIAEEYLYKELKKMFENIQVIWLNESEEQGFPYDFLIKDGSKKFYYECKGSSSDLNEFQLTRNEWNFYLDNRKNYRVCFVSNVESNPSYIRLMDLLEDMSNKTIVPCSSKNKKIRANRIVFRVC
ncbi:DUF3883 domain-containing protein [uncultured Polaribacter sp.]|uniref:protein NO VEIN domain-containing protein n=1 Tax=uncultured Polaribacter sp. TaxID=174711 RepID=UPI002611F481|nr:DUF3883 domain-containing protein [uncultured Polaribacter sp.]